jgi:predicted RNase H-like HicB family nuclease
VLFFVSFEHFCGHKILQPRESTCLFCSAIHNFFTMIIKAIVHNAEEGGFWAEVPALPGCLTQGETREEIRENLLEAIEVWFEAGEVAEGDEKESQIMELAI